MATEHEPLTSQIDGVKSLFDTTFVRRIGKTTLLFNGEQTANFTEPNGHQLQLGFTPVPGNTLHAIYETDETFDGRVQGFIDDPLGSGPLPPTLEDRLDAIDDKNLEQDQRLDNLEAGGQLNERKIDVVIVNATIATTNQFSLEETPLDVNDVKVAVQGVEFTPNDDFNVVGNVVNWLSPIPLEVGEEIVVTYEFIPAP